MTDWVRWPVNLAEEYVKKFDRQTVGGLHAVVMDPRHVGLRDGIVEAEVVDAPAQDANVLTTIKGKGRLLVTGGNVKGDTVAGNNRWRKVWVPGKDSAIGYIPWSQTWTK